MSEPHGRRQIMTRDDLSRTLHRMAHQMWETNAGSPLAMVGIHSRGVILAERLRGMLEEIAGEHVPLGELDIGLYRDDIGLTGAAPQLRSTEIPFDVDGRSIVLVDDVLFTGRTVRAALNALMDLGRPRRVQLAVLLDRGHRELPIQADFSGCSIKTLLDEEVRVALEDVDGEEGVYIVPAP